MKALTKASLADKSKHQQAIDVAVTELESAIGGYNETVNAAKQKVEDALKKLNDAISSADNWRDGIHADQESYFEDRSEKWQESDAGQNYSAWMDEWSQEFEQVELEYPEELEMPDVSGACALDDLQEAAN